MPHDCNGKLLTPGQTVILRGKVTEIYEGETACNCNVEVYAPEGEYGPSLTLNSKSLEVVAEAGEVDRVEDAPQATGPVTDAEVDAAQDAAEASKPEPPAELQSSSDETA